MIVELGAWDISRLVAGEPSPFEVLVKATGMPLQRGEGAVMAWAIEVSDFESLGNDGSWVMAHVLMKLEDAPGGRAIYAVEYVGSVADLDGIPPNHDPHLLVVTSDEHGLIRWQCGSVEGIGEWLREQLAQAEAWAESEEEQ